MPFPADTSVATTIALIVNPIAGMGGSVGLKGTDGATILADAIRRGAQPLAPKRATLALCRLSSGEAPFRLLAGPGPLGEETARSAGLYPIVIEPGGEAANGPARTRGIAAAMAKERVDLILFAGGDGTARDVLAGVGDRVPILGIPAGVKMHSAVFATNPPNAGALAALIAAGDRSVRMRQAEVMDLDEEAFRNDRLAARLYGYALSPQAQQFVQNAKSGTAPGGDSALDAVAWQIASEMQQDWLYILGPGTSTRRVADAIGVPSTLLGVDAVLDGERVGADLSEQALLRLMEGREAVIIVGVLGGQGSLFGRGNQQISAEVLRRAGRDRIVVLAMMEKLVALNGAPLRVDTGDAEVDAMLTGHLRIRTAPNRSVLMRVAP